MPNCEPTLSDLILRHEGTPFGLGLAWLATNSHKGRITVLEGLLNDCYRHLSDNRHLNGKQSEDELSTQIVGMLEMAGIQASHDTQVGGHVDILVKAKDGFQWIGEAKIHGAYDWIDDGFLQLSSRYGLAQYGRDHGEVIIYHRGGKSAHVLNTWKAKLLEDRPEVTLVEDRVDPELYFRTTHECEGGGCTFFTRHKIVPLHFKPKK